MQEASRELVRQKNNKLVVNCLDIAWQRRPWCCKDDSFGTYYDTKYKDISATACTMDYLCLNTFLRH